MKLRFLLVAGLALAAAACSPAAVDTTTTQPRPSTPSTSSAAPPTPSTPNTSTQGQPPATDAAARGYVPVLQESACEFDVPADRNPTCGNLVVPEDRNEPSGQSVRLHVAIFESTGDAPRGDAVVYLEGGPGGYALEQLQFGFEDRFGALTEDRDLVFFDQRGVGLSDPDLSCPEVRDIGISLMTEDLTPEEFNAREAPALQACADRLAAWGVDVTAYTSADNAADVADLREALGYDTWNLYGISYGTRLALTIMRDHPEGIRSVILDSTVPLQHEMLVTGPPSAQQAHDRFFADCAADARCAAAYPDLKDRYAELVLALNDAPVTVEVQNFATSARYPALLTGDELSALLFQSLYSEELIPLLPDMIVDAEQGDYALAARIASAFFTQGDFFSLGMYLAVQCSEEYAFTTVGDAEAAARKYPDVAYIYADPAGEFAECELFGAGTSDSIETQPVISDIPTLIVAGEFDPITPPSYGQTVAGDLSASYFFEYPGLAHGVTTSGGCPSDMMLAFLANPGAAPDSACLASMAGPEYFVEGDLQINLVPFSEDFLNVTISGVVPDDWTSQGFGAYVAPGLGESGIVHQVVPSGLLTADALLTDLATQFDLDGTWEESTYESARSWDIKTATAGDMTYDIAFTEDGGFLYMVVLVTVPELHDEYYTGVMLPALDAVQVS